MAKQLAIDYVSPLPPVRSGIADYSLDLLPHLERLCDLRVIRLPGQPVDRSVVERWHPHPAEETGFEGRLPLYQMGNNRYHEGVEALALERPGVLTLHDLVLHHLAVEVTLAEGVLEPYLERLEADHGWVGEAVGQARKWWEIGQAALFTLHAHRTLLRSQRGVLVHSDWAVETLCENDPELQVRRVPMGIPLAARPDPQAGLEFRRRLGVEEGTALLGSFGFQTPIKRTDRVIAALAREELSEAHLVIAGEISPALELEEEAHQRGVADRVHITGFLDYREFEAAISACDLCVNLRYPTAGETSASLLRVLAVGRPVVVSDYAQSAELPEEVVVKVPLGEAEVETLAARLGSLLKDRDRLRRMAEASREYIRSNHDPERAAAAVADACRDLGELPPPGPGRPDLEPPTTRFWHQVEGEIDVAGAHEPWPEGERRRLRVRLRNRGLAHWLSSREDVGGLILEIHWRRGAAQEAMDSRWFRFSRPVAPGESTSLEAEVRRPLGGRLLIVEPHLAEVAGFRSLGGPWWYRIFE